MNYYKFSIFIGLWTLFCSCSPRKYLKEDEVLLRSNKIEIEGKRSIENKLQLSQQLGTLYKQKPNTNWLFIIPREWLHYKVLNLKNKDKWWAKSLSKQTQPPALLDTNLANATNKNLTNYLYNQGYFNATARYQIKVKNKYGYVTYFVNPYERYYINDIQYIADDTVIHKLINNNLEASFLKPGEPVDNSLFQNEKARISELLFNNGYAEFNPAYIQTLELDTIHQKANIKLRIKNPEGRSSHPQYTINSVEVNPFYLPIDSLEYVQVEHDSLLFNVLPYYKFVRNSVIASKIKFRPGNIANKSLLDQSYVQLSKLGIYRFVNIEAKIDTVDKSAINYNIQLSPLKKWVLDYGADFNYTSIKTAGKTLFGVSGFVNLKNRNLFKGAESFSTKIEAGSELDLLGKNTFNSFNINYSNELSLPSYYEITGTLGLAKFLTKPFITLDSKPDSRTNFRIGANYEILTDYYSFISLNANIDYDWQIKKRKRVSLHTLGFSLYIPTTTNNFDSILKKNPVLEKSFKGSRVFTSYFVDNFTLYYQSKIKNNYQHAVIFNTNFSGLEVSLINSIYNSVSNKDEEFRLGEFEFSKFIKAEIDYRLSYTFSDKSKLASRFAIGFATPFGTSEFVPYIKQFYVGGPQSLRAWNIREPGPGSDQQIFSIDDRQIYFAAGDIKIESSIEYRFDIVWRFKGALFLDVGNIWLLPDPENEPGSFSSDFYNDLAIGTGLGLRLDLSYFLFRVDIGFKLRRPYEQDGSHWVYSKSYPVSVRHLFDNSTIHLALNYPF